MKKFLAVFVVLSSLVLGGCTIPKPAVHIFNGTKECDLAWQRAQLKLANISTLSVVTDVLIQGTRMEMNHPFPVRATRQNNYDGSCIISISAVGAFAQPLTDNSL